MTKTTSELIQHFDREIASAQSTIDRFNTAAASLGMFNAFASHGRDIVEAAATIFVATAIRNDLARRLDEALVDAAGASVAASEPALINAAAESLLALVLTEAENVVNTTDPIHNAAQAARKAYTARALRVLRGGF